jgi:YfiH family protein
MIQKKIDSLSLWFFENLLTCKRIGHFVSTRLGGHSDPPYDSLNLSFNVGDDPDTVLKNRRRLAGALGIPLTTLTTAKQIHDGHVKVVSETLRGRGSTNYQGAINATDAMVTNAENACLMILLADCVPILFCDPSKRVIGAAHAGWRGTLRFVAHNTVKVFREDFGCSPEDIVVGIGPSIGPCCYEVGQDVASQVRNVFGTGQDGIHCKFAKGRAHFDLWTANLEQLIQAGIRKKNIEVAKTCTRHHPELFFSHRHEKGKTGRFGAGIVILPFSNRTT